MIRIRILHDKNNALVILKMLKKLLQRLKCFRYCYCSYLIGFNPSRKPNPIFFSEIGTGSDTLLAIGTTQQPRNQVSNMYIGVEHDHHFFKTFLKALHSHSQKRTFNVQ